MHEYLLLILLLPWRLTVCLSSPTLEDNMLPTDEEVISDLINSYRRGQPEQEIALNLPTDEEAFNEIKPILQSGNPFYYINGGGHFISSSFPEIDARGFHESVFDDLDDFYPISQRGKKYDSSSLAVSARGFYGDVFTDGFGNFHPVKRYYKNRDENSRQKRSYVVRSSAETFSTSSAADARTFTPTQTFGAPTPRHCSAPDCSSSPWNAELTEQPLASASAGTFAKTPPLLPPPQNRTKTWSTRHGRSPSTFPNRLQFDWTTISVPFSHPKQPKRKEAAAASSLVIRAIAGAPGTGGSLHELRKRSTPSKRNPQIGESGFHGDLFHNQFGKFDTLKRDPSGFHGDVFHKNFGKFETLRKRNRDRDDDNDVVVAAAVEQNFHTPKRRPQPNGVNADAFYSNFGNFETLKRAAPLGGHHDNDDDDSDDDDSDERRFVYLKRRPQASVLNGDAFHSNFGAFDTMKRRIPAGDAFYANFGRFEPMKRTLAGDAFHSNFGTFDTMKRTLGGDAFHSQFGRFETMKRAGRPAAESTAADQLPGGRRFPRCVQNQRNPTASYDAAKDASSRMAEDTPSTVDLIRSNKSSARSK